MTALSGSPDRMSIEPTTAPLEIDPSPMVIDQEHFTGIVIELHDAEQDEDGELRPLDCWVTNIDPILVPAILRQVADGWRWTGDEDGGAPMT